MLQLIELHNIYCIIKVGLFTRRKEEKPNMITNEMIDNGIAPIVTNDIIFLLLLLL